jgi:tyrosyl-tRNA synthetase
VNGLDVLQERGFVHQVADADGLRQALAGQVTVYCGYDPTDSSLTHGNLVTIMMLANLQRAGARPIVLMGGGTGMVGDPSDKDSARPLLTIDQIDANVANQKLQLSRYLDFANDHALIVNNADWLRGIGFLDFLRDVGRFFSINQMTNLEFVRRRLEAEQNLSFLEFSYILLQSYDYLELYRRYGCTLQVGGSDQWANILHGADLIRRVEGGRAFALVAPLVTASSGRKISKSEGNAVYLDPNRTSPYEFYQFWVNTEDADVERFLAIYTFLPIDEVRRLGALQDADLRHAKEVLAFEATKLTHGEEEARKAEEASRALFRGESASIDAVPTTRMSAARFAEGVPLADVLVEAGLYKSKNEARSRIAGGGARINGGQVTDPRFVVSEQHLKDGALLLSAGKRHHRVVAE